MLLWEAAWFHVVTKYQEHFRFCVGWKTCLHKNLPQTILFCLGKMRSPLKSQVLVLINKKFEFKISADVPFRWEHNDIAAVHGNPCHQANKGWFKPGVWKPSPPEPKSSWVFLSFPLSPREEGPQVVYLGGQKTWLGGIIKEWVPAPQL